MTRCIGVNTTCDPEHENRSVKDGWIESKQEKKEEKLNFCTSTKDIYRQELIQSSITHRKMYYHY